MTQATTTNQEPILKRIYGDSIADPLYKRSKFCMQMRKDTNFGGEGRYVNVRLSGTAGGSADFATAVASEAPTDQKRFFVTHRKIYSTFSIQGDLIARTNGDKNAMMEAVKQETDSSRYNFFRSLARAAWGGGGGARGQLDLTTSLTGAVAILRNAGDIIWFEKNMKVQFALDNGTGTSPAGVLDGGETLTVVSINKSPDSGNPTVTFSANLDTISGITTSAYLFQAGDYAQQMTGVFGWNPVVAPSAGESFFGVDRTVGDEERQRGVIFPKGSLTTYEEILVSAAAAGAELGVEDVNHCYVNPVDFGRISLEFGDKKRSFMDDKTYRISYDGLELATAAGTIRIVAEQNVPRGYYQMMNPDEWTLRTAGDCPRILPTRKDLMVPLEGDDAARGAIGAYGNFFKENPGNSIQGSF